MAKKAGTVRRKPRASAARRTSSAVAPTRPEPGPVALRAAPTGHAVCRGCGRILRLALALTDGPNLEAFLDRRPDGWSAEGISLTVTGLCPTCQSGGMAPG
jgi:Fe2+ or Zn2+ uptake regulation protein